MTNVAYLNLKFSRDLLVVFGNYSVVTKARLGSLSASLDLHIPSRIKGHHVPTFVLTFFKLIEILLISKILFMSGF